MGNPVSVAYLLDDLREGADSMVHCSPGRVFQCVHTYNVLHAIPRRYAEAQKKSAFALTRPGAICASIYWAWPDKGITRRLLVGKVR